MARTRKVNPNQINFDSPPEAPPSDRMERLALLYRQKRVELILKTFDLMSEANSKGGFGYRLKKQDEQYKNHKISHPLSADYPNANPQKEYELQEDLYLLAAKSLASACFYCREPKKSCFIDTLPDDDNYRFKWGFEPVFRSARSDREPFRQELAKNPDAICFPYHPSPGIDK